jgi:pseudouridylate synthase / pseudouridine kinase
LEHSIPQKEIDIAIEEAVRERNRLRIIGKDVTPFLLQRVVNATKGRSLTANIALIEDNARVGAEIAIALASLENASSFQHPIKELVIDQTPSDHSPTDIMVIGSMAVDLTCTLPNVSTNSLQLHTSHPARMHTSVGGVAHNVALAASYASSNPVRLITALGSDPDGTWLREYAQNIGLDVKFISANAETARYVATHDKDGDLLFAAADMRIIETFRTEDLKQEIRRGKPKFVAFDGNISPESIKAILEESGHETKGMPKQMRK